MTTWLRHWRNLIHPRAVIAARGWEKRIRASDIIVGMSLVLIVIVTLAIAITHLFTAA